MSSVILSGDLTVYYLDESRRKQIKWTGGALKSDTQIMIDVYDATEDLMTSPDQSNDGLIFDAPTPGEFIVGKIDAGEIEPWFIDLRTMEHIIGNNGSFTGCAMRTSGWNRDLPGDGTGNTGIVVVPITNIDIDDADIGDTISHADGDSGTLLDFYDNGTVQYLWIRPDSSALANDWNSTSGTITMGSSGQTATQGAAAHTGEMVWGNVFTSGALVSDTHIFIISDGTKLVAANQTDNDFWIDGHLDRAIPIKDWTVATFPTIDEGVLTVKANQYGSKYFPIVIRMNTNSGGNVSAGLTSGNDTTNNTGYASITVGGGTGNFSVGDEISGDVSNARAIVTQIDNPGATATYHYYLIGDPLTDFDGSEAITNEDDTGAATSSGAVTAQGPALAGWFDGAAFPTYTYANVQIDVDDDSNVEEYAIEIDVNQASLSQLTEYNKYIARRGSVIAIDGIDGEQWIGIDYAINYSTITGTVNEGAVVTGATSGATGTVVSNPAGSSNTALIRDTRGTFIDGEDIYENTGTDEFDASGLTVEVIVPIAENSFGVLAGTTLFLSRGVVISDYKSAEENLWSTIDATGVVKSRPTSITVSMLNLLQYDWATWFRLDGPGGSIDKTEYSATGGETFASSTLTVDGTIAADVPNKTAGGRFFLRDADADGQEYVIRFSSFDPATGIVTLAQSIIPSADGATSTTINETGAFTAALVKVGDIVVNSTIGGIAGVSYITERVDDDNVIISPPIVGQAATDVITIGGIPNITVNTADDVAFAIMHAFRETAGTESVSMVYVGDIDSLARLRNTTDAAIKIKGASSAVTIGTGGGQASPPRIPNTVYGS